MSRGIGGVFAAEFVVLARRPAALALGGALVAFVLVPYQLFGWASAVVTGFASGAAEVVALGTAPNAPWLAANGIAARGGVLALALGALVVGGDHEWGTGTTRRLHARHLGTVVAGRLGALAIVLLAVTVLAMVATFAVASALPTGGHDVPSGAPSMQHVLIGGAITWLVLACWACIGTALAALLRSGAAALGIGAFYALVLDSVLSAIRDVAWVERVQAYSLDELGAAAAQLASSRPVGSPDSEPMLALGVLGAVTISAVAVTALRLTRGQA